MSRITKEMAGKLTLKLLEAKKKELDKMEKEFEKTVFDEYVKATPVSVKRLAKKEPKYFDLCDYIYLDRPYDRRMISAPKGQNYIHKNRSAYWKPTGEADAKLFKLFTALEKAQSKYKELYRELENALLALRTPKKINEAFPELKVPEPPTAALIVNIADLKMKIAQ